MRSLRIIIATASLLAACDSSPLPGGSPDAASRADLEPSPDLAPPPASPDLTRALRVCDPGISLPDYAGYCARAGGSLSADAASCPYCLLPQGANPDSVPPPPCCAPTDACSGPGEPCATVRPCCGALRCVDGAGGPTCVP